MTGNPQVMPEKRRGDRELKTGFSYGQGFLELVRVCLASVTVYIKKMMVKSLLNNIADEYKNNALAIKIEL